MNCDLNCTFNSEITKDNLTFWAENSYQHIDVLLGADSPEGPILFECTKRNLKKLSAQFKAIYKRLIDMDPSDDLCKIRADFLITNDHLILLLQRLKFEGYNGYPNVYEATYHFLYEQMYIKQIFTPQSGNKNIGPRDVVINSYFRKIGLGNNALECAYGQIYFWCLIGAQHPSLLLNTIPNNDKIPAETKDKMNAIVIAFNELNYDLSHNYPQLSVEIINALLTRFMKLNTAFINLLKLLVEDKMLLTPKIYASLPKTFYGVYNHILDEHQYAMRLGKKMKMAFED